MNVRPNCGSDRSLLSLKKTDTPTRKSLQLELFPCYTRDVLHSVAPRRRVIWRTTSMPRTRMWVPIFPLFATPFSWYASISTSVHHSEEMLPQRRLTKRRGERSLSLLLFRRSTSDRAPYTTEPWNTRSGPPPIEPPTACIHQHGWTTDNPGGHFFHYACFAGLALLFLLVYSFPLPNFFYPFLLLVQRTFPPLGVLDSFRYRSKLCLNFAYPSQGN